MPQFCGRIPRMPDTPLLLAAVDLGSNSFRLVIGRVESTPLGDQIRPVDQLKETVRLAAGLGDGNTLSEAAQARAVDALRRFGERLRAFPPERVRAVATNTFRVASDVRPFLERAQKALGFGIEVIAGREEARLIYLGAAHALPVDGRRRLVVDIGGGSTECIVGTDYVSEQLESVPLGCVSLTRRFFPDGSVDRASFDAARYACRDALAPIAARYREAGWKAAIGTSGTAKSLWQVAQADLGEPRLTPAVLASLQDALLKAGHPDRLRFTALKPDRRPVLPGGLAMLGAVFEELGVESMDYCDGALREGVLYDLLGRSSGADMREVTVARMVRRHGLDDRHGEAVAELASTLYRETARGGADELARAARLLRWAARLREIGQTIAHDDFHKHGAYILEHCDMPGFSEDDQRRLDPGARPDRRADQAARPHRRPGRVAAGPVPAAGGDAAPPPRRTPAAVDPAAREGRGRAGRAAGRVDGRASAHRRGPAARGCRMVEGRALAARIPDDLSGVSPLPLQPLVPEHQLLARLGPVGVLRDALHRADLPALRRVEVPDALGAAFGVDHVDLGAHRDRAVRALGLADVAVDALIGDDQGHRAPGATATARRSGAACARDGPAPTATRTCRPRRRRWRSRAPACPTRTGTGRPAS